MSLHSVALRSGRAAASIIAFASAAAGALLLAGPSFPGADVLADLAPLLLALALIVLAVAFALRLSRAVLAAACIGLLAPAWLMAPEFIAAANFGPGADPTAPRLKLLTANLWSANTNYEAFEALIRREQPDIIVVQEAWPPWQQVLRGLAPEYEIQVGCRAGSDCNVVILSKLALQSVVAPATAQMAAVRLELPARLGGGAVEVVGVHLDHPTIDGGEDMQMREMRAIADTFGDRAFIAGDFNATPWSQDMLHLDEIIPLERRTRAFFSWPTPTRSFTRWRVHSPVPLFAIDQVYAGRDWRLVEIHRGPDIGSDHFPIIATFALRTS